MAHEVLTAVKVTPVLAGVCATDPFLLRDRFLRELKDMGFAGIQNFPTVGLIDGVLRINLEETGMGFSHEIDCIAAAHELDMLTTPYAFDPGQARLLAQAGADLVVAHMGLTTTGSIGAVTAKTLDDCVREVTAIAEAAKKARGRSRHPGTLSMCCLAHRRLTGFMEPARWSGFRPSWRSRGRYASSWDWRSGGSHEPAT
jgi:predicted TIM-barrel enzyme